MKTRYSDILSRIKEDPIWFDENGVPRYDTFHPTKTPSVYADEAALILISCQACNKEFNVSLHYEKFNVVNGKVFETQKLSEKIPYLYYGDPPDIGCCSVGPTMSSNSVKVLEFWSKENGTWVRKPELEVNLKE